MKKLILAVAVAGIFAGSCASAFAGDTAELKVQGTLTTGACTPTIDNNGVVDLGKIDVSDLSASSANPQAEQSVNFAVTCKSAMEVGFTVNDDRHDTVAPVTVSEAGKDVSTADNLYGLGATTDGVPIGAYTLSIDPNAPTFDGSTGMMIFTQDGGTGWMEAINGDVIPANNSALVSTVAATSGALAGTPAAFTNATFPIKVDSTIQDSTTLAITDDTPIDGQATITLVYL